LPGVAEVLPGKRLAAVEMRLLKAVTTKHLRHALQKAVTLRALRLPGIRCGCASADSVTDTKPCGSLALGEVMGAILPKLPSGEFSGEVFSLQTLLRYLGRGYNTSRKTANWRRLVRSNSGGKAVLVGFFDMAQALR
jgi:hypothetical protein